MSGWRGTRSGGGGRVEEPQKMEKSGLAGSGCTDQSDAVALLDGEIDAGENRKRIVPGTIGLAERFGSEDGLGHWFYYRR